MRSVYGDIGLPFGAGEALFGANGGGPLVAKAEEESQPKL